MIIKEELEENPLVKMMYELPYYNLLFQNFTSEKLNADWFEKVKNLPFEKSHFGINEVGRQQRVYDDSVRLSQFVKADLPELDQIVNYYLQCWSNEQTCDNILTGGLFNCLRYPNGHFAWHMDKVRPKQGYEHIGTVVIIPPQQLVQYNGGTLLLFDPHQKEWTFIMLPLGFMHTVEPVKGMRYSFTREVYFKLNHPMRKMTEKDKINLMNEHRNKIKMKTNQQ